MVRRIRRTVLSGLAIAGLLAMAPVATRTAGASIAVPTAVATPADDVAHPGSGTTTEWWYAEVSDPSSSQTFILSLIQLPQKNSSDFWYDKNGSKSNTQTSLSSFTSSSTYPPNVQTNVGSLVYDTTAQAYHLVYNNTSDGKSANIWFYGAKPGVTVGPDYVSGGQTMFWTNPVLTSSVSGWIKPGSSSSQISVNGWRGYHDHNWGKFDLTNQGWRGWEWGVSHNPDGSGTAMFSVVNADGTYAGETIHATATGTTFCNANYTASNWTWNNGEWFPLKVVQNCPAAPNYNDTWTVTQPYVLNTFGVFLLEEGEGNTVPGSVGLIEHGRTGSYNYLGS
jgi:hypothetical protein